MQGSYEQVIRGYPLLGGFENAQFFSDISIPENLDFWVSSFDCQLKD
jgi:hypothetical protein